MAERYDPQAVEPRWRQRWEATGLYAPRGDDSRPKKYVVTMYPYPSGELHVGHWYPTAPTDAAARFYRMRGFDVLFPMGFDAFGLPAENAAIRNNVHPRDWTYRNIRRMEEQFRAMGACFDWRAEIITCDPEYYRWNQWFFLKFLERGLAYRKHSPVDWCPQCNTTLAREQVLGQERRCERCETPVVKKDLNQWYFRITEYAEELLDFSRLAWPEKIITLQRNWIGKSTGAEFDWQVRDSEARFRVFTTRPDTVYGATFCVLAPEHPLVAQITTPECRTAVDAYAATAARQTEIDRLSTEKERTGVFTGAHAVHPLTGADVPIWIADYVLMTYGTGAIMAVPAHDERDFDFARRHGLPIPMVVVPPDWDGHPLGAPHTGPGVMANSGPFDGLPSDEGGRAIAAEFAARGIGGPAINYRLRDWLISRQRMWGTPIPIVYCATCGTVPVPEEQLPVLLPEAVEFKPTGESPLKLDPGFLHTECPRCGGPAERETDTMDTFVDSAWYQYRFLSPHYGEGPFDPAAAARWAPVDLYTGGAEHAVMHLLYSRFFHKVIRDLGLLDEARAARPDRCWDEPFPRLFSQGVITSFAYRDPDGRFVGYADVEFDSDRPVHRVTRVPLSESAEKMSKSKLNVISPDEYVHGNYGADVVRLFLMFIGPWDQGGPWNPRGVEGVVRFLNRCWSLATDPAGAPGEPDPAAVRDLRRATHQTIRKVTADLERFAFNTVVAALMEFTNTLQRLRATPAAGTEAWAEALDALTLLLAPVAPHLAEELWAQRGREYSVHSQPWPAWSKELAAEDSIEIVVQVNGKVRDRLTVPATADEAAVRACVEASPRLAEALSGREIRKFVYVPGRLVNLVVA